MQLIVDKVVGIKDIPYTYIFGLGKSLIACGLLLTVLVDGSEILFAPDASRFPQGRCVESSILEYSLFCIAGFELGRWIAVLIFLFVVVGLLPAVFSIPFAYAAWSLQATIAVPEGGDQLASNLALILIPISLLDWRLTQWAPRNSGLDFNHKWSFFRNNVRITCVVVLWLQMAVVYFFAAIEKIPVEEWREGTAIYYWATDPNFGATGIRLSVLNFFAENLFFVVLITWGTIVLELLLAFGWMAQPRIKDILLILGMGFHFGIAFFMGLLSFSIIMSGALLMYLGPNSSLRLKKMVPICVREESTVKAQGESKGVI